MEDVSYELSYELSVLRKPGAERSSDEPRTAEEGAGLHVGWSDKEAIGGWLGDDQSEISFSPAMSSYSREQPTTDSTVF